MKKYNLTPIFIVSFLFTNSNLTAAYSWVADPGITADETAMISAPGSIVNGEVANYHRFTTGDEGDVILYGVVTDGGASADFAITLTEFTNIGSGGATTNPNDNAFAIYGNGGMDVFTKFVSRPTDALESNARIQFDIQLYNLGTYNSLTNTGTIASTGIASLGSPLNSNAIIKLADDEEYGIGWTGTESGTIYDPSSQIATISAPGSLEFYADPSIGNVLTSNYAIFSAQSSEFSIVRQDRLTTDSDNGASKTGQRSGITIGASSILLPGGNNIPVPEPSSIFLLGFGGIVFTLRRHRK